MVCERVAFSVQSAWRRRVHTRHRSQLHGTRGPARGARARGANSKDETAPPLAERIRRDKRERSDRSSDDSSSDQDSCGTGSTSEANDIFDTLDDHLGYGSDSGSGW